MAKPTWSGWLDVLAAQQADVSGTGDFYPGLWKNDPRNWVPEVSITGMKWNYLSEVKGQIDFDMKLEKELNEVKNMWKPQGEEKTTWQEVPYPK